MLALHGRSPDVQQLVRQLAPQGDGRLSMLTIRNAASQAGLIVEGRQLDRTSTLPARPFIAYLSEPEGHFVVIRPIGRTQTLVQVLDGMNEPFVIDHERLKNSPSWTGRILITPEPTLRLWLLAITSGFVLLLLIAIWRTGRAARSTPWWLVGRARAG
jgi:hypothetical protein